MNSLDFEKGRAEEKCIDFKSNIIRTNLEDCYIIEENIPSEIFNNPQQERTKAFLSKVL